MTDGAPIGVGVVGLGMISRPHLEGYKAASGAELVAVCDVDPARAQAEGERYGATAYTDLTTLLADPRVDAVALQLPHQLHHRLAKQALEAGKHVIVEKPLTVSEAEAEDSSRPRPSTACGSPRPRTRASCVPTSSSRRSSARGRWVRSA